MWELYGDILLRDKGKLDRGAGKHISPFFLNIFINLFYFLYMNNLPVCMHVHHEARQGPVLPSVAAGGGTRAVLQLL